MCCEVLPQYMYVLRGFPTVETYVLRGVLERQTLWHEYRAVSQFFAAFENNSNFGEKVLTGTDFRSKFVKMALSH